jgi:hypothetical protein
MGRCIFAVVYAGRSKTTFEFRRRCRGRALALPGCGVDFLRQAENSGAVGFFASEPVNFACFNASNQSGFILLLVSSSGLTFIPAS